MYKENAQIAQLLDSIAVTASTPIERLQRGWVTNASSSEPEKQARLQNLYEMVGAENEQLRKQLFNHLPFSRKQIIKALSSSLPLKITSRPSWVDTLEQILLGGDTRDASQNESDPLFSDPCLQPEYPQPFEELFLPFIRYARNQLRTHLPITVALLSKEAHLTLERRLLQQLLSLAAQPLYNEFTQFRISSESFEDILEEEKTSRKLYHAFLSRYEGEGLLTLFREYSVLARLLVQITVQWIEICQEFLQRLATDQQEIGRYFWPTDHLVGNVVMIQPGCSDPHHNGRTVFLLTFSNGHHLLYKPHCLDIDVAFFQFLTWINEQGSSLKLKATRPLSRATYGWVEYIEHLPCETHDAVQRYYQRSGQLLCLFYVLHASDMHYENIIAHGEYPIPIDIETVVTPPHLMNLSINSSPMDPQEEIKNTFAYSLSQSTLLPMKMFVQETQLDLSFLGCISGFVSPYMMLSWKQINTDKMHQIFETQSVEPAKNAVLFDGSLMKAIDYLEDIVTGFQEMYHILIKHRDTLLAPEGPLASFRGCPARFVFRSTNIYEKHLLRLSHPHFLRDNVDRWIDMQIFNRALLKNEATPLFWSIISSEVSALARLDVPRFEIDPDRTDLFTGEGSCIENIFSRTALAQVHACLNLLSDEDMKGQIKSIRDAFADASIPLIEATSK